MGSALSPNPVRLWGAYVGVRSEVNGGRSQGHKPDGCGTAFQKPAVGANTIKNYHRNSARVLSAGGENFGQRGTCAMVSEREACVRQPRFPFAEWGYCNRVRRLHGLGQAPGSPHSRAPNHQGVRINPSSRPSRSLSFRDFPVSKSSCKASPSLKDCAMFLSKLRTL